jgi:hypothetical protein
VTGVQTCALPIFSIPVTAANDAPVNAVPGAQTIAEDNSLNLTGATAIAISDVDAGGASVQVTLTATNGTLTLSGTSGLTFSTGDGTADASMTFTGTIADINTALDGMTYTPTGNFNGAASVTIVTDDLGNSGAGGALADSDSVSITVTAVNDAPVNTVPGAQTMAEDSPLTFSGAAVISISDVDAGGASVQVTLTATNGTLTLAGTAGLTFMSGDGTADATMTFTGTIANINAALNGAAFNPAAGFAGAASVTIATDDLGNSGAGGALTDSDSVSITVTAVNDARSEEQIGRAHV